MVVTGEPPPRETPPRQVRGGSAEAADNQEVVNAENQAKTIKARVEQLSTQGGYEVRNGAFVALD
ncbi:MAG: hypothetical protein ABWX96_09310, partial [Propionibacteriaceae bacterium]